MRTELRGRPAGRRAARQRKRKKAPADHIPFEAGRKEGRTPMAGTLLSEGLSAALLDTETYWWHLARLRESRSRAEAARHARSMAGATARRYAVLAGAPGVGDQDGDFTWTGCDEDDPGDREAHRAWQGLAATITRSEFAAAWQPVGRGIEALADPRGDGSPAPLREFTAIQVAWAAAAITEAPW